MRDRVLSRHIGYSPEAVLWCSCSSRPGSRHRRCHHDGYYLQGRRRMLLAHTGRISVLPWQPPSYDLQVNDTRKADEKLFINTNEESCKTEAIPTMSATCVSYQVFLIGQIPAQAGLHISLGWNLIVIAPAPGCGEGSGGAALHSLEIVQYKWIFLLQFIAEIAHLSQNRGSIVSVLPAK